MDRKIIDYLPPNMSCFEEVKAVMQTEQIEFESLYYSINAVLNNYFVETCDEYGVSRIEKMLGLEGNSSMSLETRKNLIITKMNMSKNYNKKNVEDIITMYCGSRDNFYYDINDKTLNVYLTPECYEILDTIYDFLNSILPLDLIIRIILGDNTYKKLSNYTHSQLSKYTNKELHRSKISEKEGIFVYDISKEPIVDRYKLTVEYNSILGKMQVGVTKFAEIVQEETI